MRRLSLAARRHTGDRNTRARREEKLSQDARRNVGDYRAFARREGRREREEAKAASTTVPQPQNIEPMKFGANRRIEKREWKSTLPEEHR